MFFLSLTGKFIINSLLICSSGQTFVFSNLLHLLRYGQANKFLNFGEVIQKILVFSLDLHSLPN